MGNLDIDRFSELQASTYDITIHGNWTTDAQDNSNFDPGTGTVTFRGNNANQTYNFTGTSGSETFYDLVIK